MRRTSVKHSLGALVLAVTTAAALGCGGSSSDADQFIGTWMITQASAMVACNDGTGGLARPTGNVQFAPGATTAIVAISPAELDPSSYCDFAFDVKGTTATVHGVQSCTLRAFSAPPINASISPTTWTFALTGPNDAEETGSATLQLPAVDATGAPTGATTLCQYTNHMATLTRVAKK